MPRQIIAEEPQQEEQDEQQLASAESSVSDSVTTTANTSGINGESTIITAREMEKLFHEWNANGQNDLCINQTLAERIQQYLDYQEQLDPLRAKLAERIYRPYLITISPSEVKSKPFNIYVNNAKLRQEHFLPLGDFYRATHICALKTVLTFIGNPYAIYIDASKDQFVDLLGYVIANGGSFKYDNKDVAFYIEL